jgi:LacI family transcriptional regulator
MAKAPTVYDVAAHAGVSIATVSRVLTRPDDVRAATREKVLASVRELGYVPSGAARGLAARRTGVLGLYFPGFDAMDEIDDAVFTGVDDAPHATGAELVDDIGGAAEVRPLNLYFDEVLRGAELEAWRRGFVLMVGIGRGDNAEQTVRDMAGRVDGLVMLAQSVPDDVLAQLSRRVPVVVVAGPRRDDAYDHVSVANTEGMRALTEHVAAGLEPDELLYLSGPADSPDDAERWEGFCQALEARGVDASTVPILRGDFTREAGRSAAAELVAGERMPRAIVCANDQTALGLMEALQARGIRVPEDVLVTGFDGIEAGALATPRLTTIRQPMDDLGRAAIQVMARRLDDREQAPLSIRLPVKVLLRESSERR